MRERSFTIAALLVNARTAASAFAVPNAVGAPIAYYHLDEGVGFDLKESITDNPTGGRILYDADHQTVNYAEPNWMEV